MKEKKINYGLIIFIVIVIILFIPIIIDYIKSQNIEILSINAINEKIESKETFLVYIGSVEKNTKNELRTIRNLTKNDYSYEYGVYSAENIEEAKKVFGIDTLVAMVIEGDIQKNYTKFDKGILTKDVEKYFLGNITDENRSYKVAENFKSYKNLIKSDEVIVSVFGRESCYYCNKFKPVYNSVAEKYDVDIYYFDSDNYDTSQYKKIMNMNLTVPAKCSSSGEASGKEFKLSDGFGTPLTIITKSNKVIDCISGYVDRSSLIETLINNKLISE